MGWLRGFAFLRRGRLVLAAGALLILGACAPGGGCGPGPPPPPPQITYQVLGACIALVPGECVPPAGSTFGDAYVTYTGQQGFPNQVQQWVNLPFSVTTPRPNVANPVISGVSIYVQPNGNGNYQCKIFENGVLLTQSIVSVGGSPVSCTAYNF